MTIPEAPIVRLGWDQFIQCLTNLGINEPENLSEIKNAVYIRELLELAVRDDLLGPAQGPFEEIIDMSVRDRYLVGKIAPMTYASNTSSAESQTEETQTDLDLNDPETQIAQRHERTAETSNISGTIDAENDALDEIDTSNNQSLVPSSIGLTFCVAANISSINVEANWGRYERVPNDEHEHVESDETGKQVKNKM